LEKEAHIPHISHSHPNNHNAVKESFRDKAKKAIKSFSMKLRRASQIAKVSEAILE